MSKTKKEVAYHYNQNLLKTNGWAPYLDASLPAVVELDFDQLCPPPLLTYRAFSFGPPSSIKAVILGQDPYHTPGKASGLAFGYHADYKGPVDSSLANIRKAVKDTTGQTVTDLSLESWARQGVLLLNTRLSTLPGKPLRHRFEWDEKMALFLNHFSTDYPDVVWLLWGKEAQSYFKRFGNAHSPRLETSHPCKFSAHRGFLESTQFLDVGADKSIVWGEKKEEEK